MWYLYKYGPSSLPFLSQLILRNGKPKPRGFVQLFLGRREGRASSRAPGSEHRETLTVRAAAIESHPADAAVLVVGHPEPSSHAVPALDLHLHGGKACGRGKRSPAAFSCRASVFRHQTRDATRGKGPSEEPL